MSTHPIPCDPAMGAANDQGYPQVRINGVLHYRHRLAYEGAHGPIPDGHSIDHVCHTLDLGCPGGPGCPHRRCIEPSHLELVTPRENTLRGRGPSAVHAGMTHCKNGHELSPDNCYARPDGRSKRRCLTCSRRAALARYYARRAAQ